jgi:MFS family permease
MRRAAGFAIGASTIPLASTMLAVALPRIGGDLGLRPAQLTTWIVGAYLVVAILGSFAGGRVADVVGASRAMRLGLASCAASAIAGSLASSATMLVAARLLMAAGGALLVPACMALLREATPPERRARAFGAMAALMSLAAAIGPVVGGEIAQRYGWRATFAAQALPLLASALLTSGPSSSSRLGPSSSRLGPSSSRVVAARVVAARAVTPRAVASPLTAGSFLRSREFIAGALTIALQNAMTYATLFLVPMLLESRGASTAGAGRTLLALTLAMVAGSLLGGRLADRLGARATIVLAALLALGGVAIVREASALVVGLTVLGLGAGLSSGPAQATALAAASAANAASASGALAASRYLGGVAGMIVLATPAPMTGLIAIGAIAVLVASLPQAPSEGGGLALAAESRKLVSKEA